jgi:hypothetical protein
MATVSSKLLDALERVVRMDPAFNHPDVMSDLADARVMVDAAAGADLGGGDWGDTSGLEARIAALEGQVSGLSNRVAALETNDASQDALLGDHRVRLEALEPKVAALDSEAVAHGGRLDALDTQTADLETRVTTLEEAVP